MLEQPITEGSEGRKSVRNPEAGAGAGGALLAPHDFCILPEFKTTCLGLAGAVVDEALKHQSVINQQNDLCTHLSTKPMVIFFPIKIPYC